ncbi:Uncharacterised protein [Vibrio cholerae]|nr:Uncharacterised protein [Vibrio cholerae]CSC81796.1 Uncharacterised protein [Vibrio cholerae]CSC88396.1 Uncharacterised protein [Vibrio cholerae]CSI73253.1 Uncharacterised protein [Vibrio cholerae]
MTSPDILAAVCSTMPLTKPRQPACTAATWVPVRLVINTGRQSAVIAEHTTFGVEVIRPSASNTCSVGASTSSTTVEWVWFSQMGELGIADVATNDCRLRSTSTGSSPTCIPRFNP